MSRDISKQWLYEVHYTAPISNISKKVSIAAWSWDEGLQEARRILGPQVRIDGVKRVEVKQ